MIGNVVKRGTLPLRLPAPLFLPLRESWTEQLRLGKGTCLQEKANLRAEVEEVSDIHHQSWNKSRHFLHLAEEEIDRVTKGKRHRLCLQEKKEGLTPLRLNKQLLGLPQNALHQDNTRTLNVHFPQVQDGGSEDCHLHATIPLLDGTAAENAFENGTDLEQDQQTEIESVPGRGGRGTADQGVPEDRVLRTDLAVLPLRHVGAEVVAPYQGKGRESRRGGGIESGTGSVNRRERKSENKGQGCHLKILLLHAARHPLPLVPPLHPHLLLRDP